MVKLVTCCSIVVVLRIITQYSGSLNASDTLVLVFLLMVRCYFGDTVDGIRVKRY